MDPKQASLASVAMISGAAAWATSKLSQMSLESQTKVTIEACAKQANQLWPIHSSLRESVFVQCLENSMGHLVSKDTY